jgi:hypothetical protein
MVKLVKLAKVVKAVEVPWAATRGASALGLALAALGCRAAPPPDVDPVTPAQAAAFATEFAKAAMPCDHARLDRLFDVAGFSARFRHGDSSLMMDGAVASLEQTPLVPNILCAWQEGAEGYRLLRVRTVDGQPRPLFRRIVKHPRTHVSMVGYDELMLGASRTDHKVRVLDIYSYVQGQWVSESVRSVTDASIHSSSSLSDAEQLADKLKRVRALQQAGEPTQALALLDSLPDTVRKARTTQVLRVALANAISRDAYKQALDEIAAVFPGDPSVAMMQIDGAILRNEYAAALRHIDEVDRAIGGDPWQDAIRAEVLIKRGGAGDLDAAQARADAVVRADPTLAKGWWAELDVALARRAWPAAIAAMDQLQDRFHVAFDLEALRTLPVYAGLIVTPEYAAWQAKRQ